MQRTKIIFLYPRTVFGTLQGAVAKQPQWLERCRHLPLGFLCYLRSMATRLLGDWECMVDRWYEIMVTSRDISRVPSHLYKIYSFKNGQ